MFLFVGGRLVAYVCVHMCACAFLCECEHHEYQHVQTYWPNGCKWVCISTLLPDVSAT